MRLDEVRFDLAPTPENARERVVFTALRRALDAARDAIDESFSRVFIARHDYPRTAGVVAAALPTASAAYLGRFIMLDKNGAADDVLHFCIRNAVGAYVWKTVTLV